MRTMSPASPTCYVFLHTENGLVCDYEVQDVLVRCKSVIEKHSANGRHGIASGFSTAEGSPAASRATSNGSGMRTSKSAPALARSHNEDQADHSLPGFDDEERALASLPPRLRRLRP